MANAYFVNTRIRLGIGRQILLAFILACLTDTTFLSKFEMKLLTMIIVEY